MARLSSLPHSPARVGSFTAVCLVISNIVGGGIFTTTGFLARDLGDPLLILGLWVFGALLAVAGAMSYAELGAALPQAGGDYIYLRTAYHPVLGFLSGWTSFTSGFGAPIAAACVGFSGYALHFMPSSADVAPKLLALTVLWLITAVHLTGTAAGGRLQRGLTTTKVLAIAAMILGGLALGHGDWSHLTSTAPPARPGAGGLMVALIFVLYTYLGWNVAGYVAAEIDEPARNVPRVIIAGTAFVALLYLLLNVVYFYAVPVEQLAAPPLLPVAEKAAAALWGAAAASFVTALLCLAIAGGVSAMVWAGPRVYSAMARDGAFLAFFAAVHTRTGVPVRAMLLQSLWASLLILTGTFEQLVIFSGFVLALFTALTVTGVFVLRLRQPDLPRPYRVPFYPVLPAFVVGTLMVIVIYSAIERPIESAWGVASVLAGLPLYAMWTASARRVAGPE